MLEAWEKEERHDAESRKQDSNLAKRLSSFQKHALVLAA